MEHIMDTEETEDIIQVETTLFHTNQRRRRWSGSFTRPPRENLSDSPTPSPGDSDNDDYFEQETDNTPHEVAPRRSTRRRIRPASPPKCSSSVPNVKQRKLTENSSLKDIENYYLDKRVKRLNPSLETIFEGSDPNNEDATVMSNRKYRRVIDFKPPTVKNTNKIKKRKMKAKKINSKKNKKVSLKFLMDKLAEVSDD